MPQLLNKAYTILNTGVSHDYALDVGRWLENNGIKTDTSFSTDNSYITEGVACYQHLFIIVNNATIASEKVRKYYAYAKMIGLPVYMVYRRRCDESLQIYGIHVDEYILSFGDNCTNWCFDKYSDNSKKYHKEYYNELKSLKALLKIEKQFNAPIKDVEIIENKIRVYEHGTPDLKDMVDRYIEINPCREIHMELPGEPSYKTKRIKKLTKNVKYNLASLVDTTGNFNSRRRIKKIK